jgi:hypothetical protein
MSPTWKEFLAQHWDVLVTADFFSFSFSVLALVQRRAVSLSAIVLRASLCPSFESAPPIRR